MRVWRQMTNHQRRAWAGRAFVSLWFIGFLLFFGRPLFMSLIYSVNQLEATKQGFVLIPVGFQNYIKALFQDPEFIKRSTAAVKKVIYEMPSIVMFSLFMAVILNQKFKGRVFFRSLFFLPVIITSGLLLNAIQNDNYGDKLWDPTTIQAFSMFQTSSLKSFLLDIGSSMQFMQNITSIAENSFNLVWKSGVQILLFLSALQSIPDSLYEAAIVEGSTAWETFWKITFPMISPMILVNIVYTMVDSFTDYQNTLMNYIIIDTLQKKINFGYSSAMAWMYFVMILAFIGIFTKLFSRNVEFD